MSNTFPKNRLADLSRALERRDLSARELCAEYIRRIEACNDNIGAYVTLCAEEALEQAELIDKRRMSGESLPILAGIPFSVKDNICTKGIRTTCASKMLEEHIPAYDATVIERLRAQGAIMLGKVNMDEFGMGSKGTRSIFGAVKNPCDLSCITGGSSSGSAASVAAETAVFSLGSDTGGSCRYPAALCGVVGFKAAYGTVSRYGLVAYATSLEQISPISEDIFTGAYVLQAISGKDARDATSIDATADLCADIGKDVSGIVVGMPLSSLDFVSDEVRRAFEELAEYLRTHGARVVDVSLPDRDDLVAAYYVISSCEASSNLGRFDGVRCGLRDNDAHSVYELMADSRSRGFGKEVKKRILIGTYLLSADNNLGYYRKAQSARARIRESFTEIFKTCDLIITPATSSTATKADAHEQVLERYRDDFLCVGANLAGLPALSVPFCKAADGKPIGMQIMCNVRSERAAVRAGAFIERRGRGYSNE